VAYLAGAHEVDVDAVNAKLEALRDETLERLHSQGVDDSQVSLTYGAEMRYHGQVYELRIPFDEFPISADTVRRMVDHFEDTYETVYTIRLADARPELVSLRVTATGTLPQYEAGAIGATGGDPEPKGSRDVLLGDGYASVDVFDRYSLPAGASLDGPVILEESGSTIWVAPGMCCEVDQYSNLMIHTDQTTASAAVAGTTAQA
jgi:N-methylhydantoinase A